MIFDVVFSFFFFLVGTGEPPPYGDKIPTKSPFCMVVVLVLKSWDWARPPPPSLGQNTNFYRFFKAPLRCPCAKNLMKRSPNPFHPFSDFPSTFNHFNYECLIKPSSTFAFQLSNKASPSQKVGVSPVARKPF